MECKGACRYERSTRRGCGQCSVSRAQDSRKCIKVITIISIVVMWIGIIVMWFQYAASLEKKGGQMPFPANENALPLSLAWFSTFCVAFMSVVKWAFGFAIAEMILLAIDVANDLRINRFLLKGIRYNTNTPNAPAGSGVPTSPPDPSPQPAHDVDGAVSCRHR